MLYVCRTLSVLLVAWGAFSFFTAPGIVERSFKKTTTTVLHRSLLFSREAEGMARKEGRRKKEMVAKRQRVTAAKKKRFNYRAGIAEVSEKNFMPQ